MPYQLWIADVARAAGLKVAEQPGWKTRGSSVFNPKAVLAHHTAIDDDAISVRVVTKGRPDLPGPLSQFVLGKDGTVYVIAAGKANHTGEGSWAGLSGNLYFFGIEAVNKGDGTPWPQVQLDAYYKLAAALVKSLGVGADKVAGHKEFATPPGRKIDPKGIDMSDFRAKVKELLAPQIVIGQPVEVDVQLTPLTLNIGPLDSNGNGWTKVPYTIDKVVGLTAHSGTRPGVDGAYDDVPNHVSATPDGAETVIVVRGGGPGATVPVWAHVIV